MSGADRLDWFAVATTGSKRSGMKPETFERERLRFFPHAPGAPMLLHSLLPGSSRNEERSTGWMAHVCVVPDAFSSVRYSGHS